MRDGAMTRMAEVLAWCLLAAVLGLAVPPQKPAGKGAATAPALPFVEDDYARALADAQHRKVPLFIEAWAPW